jgi:hypothetical protein
METLRLFFRFILVLAIDLFLLRQVHYGPLLAPVLFPWLILSMPLKFGRGWLLILAFFTGLTIDLFTHTGGVNAMALTAAAYFRGYLLPLFFSGEDFDANLRPGIGAPDIRRFTLFSLLFLLGFHLTWNTIMVARFSGIFTILLRTVSGSMLSLLTFVIWEMAIRKSPRK